MKRFVEGVDRTQGERIAVELLHAPPEEALAEFDVLEEAAVCIAVHRCFSRPTRSATCGDRPGVALEGARHPLLARRVGIKISPGRGISRPPSRSLVLSCSAISTGSRMISPTGASSSDKRFTKDVLAPFSKRRRTRYASRSS